MASADLLLHPVRLRIVKAFLGDRALTTGQLAAELDDVPPGSLYRHVALLAKAGVLQVVAERRVRGAVERTYTLRSSPDPARDGADYQVGALWLTDAEFAELLRDLSIVFQPRLANPPAPGRKRRMVYSVFLPAPEGS